MTMTHPKPSPHRALTHYIYCLCFSFLIANRCQDDTLCPTPVVSTPSRLCFGRPGFHSDLTCPLAPR